jgi:hypothetical protein
MARRHRGPSLRAVHWNEAKHPRDDRGRFAHKGGGKWLAKVAKEAGARFGDIHMGAAPGHEPRGRLQTGKGGLIDIGAARRRSQSIISPRSLGPDSAAHTAASDLKPGQHVQVHGIDSTGRPTKFNGYVQGASPVRMGKRGSRANKEDRIAVQMASTPSGANGARTVVYAHPHHLAEHTTPKPETTATGAVVGRGPAGIRPGFAAFNPDPEIRRQAEEQNARETAVRLANEKKLGLQTQRVTHEDLHGTPAALANQPAGGGPARRGRTPSGVLAAGPKPESDSRRAAIGRAEGSASFAGSAGQTDWAQPGETGLDMPRVGRKAGGMTTTPTRPTRAELTEADRLAAEMHAAEAAGPRDTIKVSPERRALEEANARTARRLAAADATRTPSRAEALFKVDRAEFEQLPLAQRQTMAAELRSLRSTGSEEDRGIAAYTLGKLGLTPTPAERVAGVRATDEPAVEVPGNRFQARYNPSGDNYHVVETDAQGRGLGVASQEFDTQEEAVRDAARRNADDLAEFDAKQAAAKPGREFTMRELKSILAGERGYAPAIRSTDEHRRLLEAAGATPAQSEAILKKLGANTEQGHLTADLTMALHFGARTEAEDEANALRSAKLLEATPRAYAGLLGDGPNAVTHPKSRQVVEAMQASGWVIKDVRAGGISTWGPPGDDSKSIVMIGGKDRPTFMVGGQKLSGVKAIEHVGGPAPSLPKPSRTNTGAAASNAHGGNTDFAGSLRAEMSGTDALARETAPRTGRTAAGVQTVNREQARSTEGVVRNLRGSVQTREAAQAELDGLTVAELRDVARQLNVRRDNATKQDLKDRIVERTVGSRINASVLRENVPTADVASRVGRTASGERVTAPRPNLRTNEFGFPQTEGPARPPQSLEDRRAASLATRDGMPPTDGRPDITALATSNSKNDYHRWTLSTSAGRDRTMAPDVARVFGGVLDGKAVSAVVMNPKDGTGDYRYRIVEEGTGAVLEEGSGRNAGEVFAKADRIFSSQRGGGIARTAGNEVHYEARSKQRPRDRSRGDFGTGPFYDFSVVEVDRNGNEREVVKTNSIDRAQQHAAAMNAKEADAQLVAEAARRGIKHREPGRPGPDALRQASDERAAQRTRDLLARVNDLTPAQIAAMPPAEKERYRRELRTLAQVGKGDDARRAEIALQQFNGPAVPEPTRVENVGPSASQAARLVGRRPDGALENPGRVGGPATSSYVQPGDQVRYAGKVRTVSRVDDNARYIYFTDGSKMTRDDNGTIVGRPTPGKGEAGGRPGTTVDTPRVSRDTGDMTATTGSIPKVTGYAKGRELEPGMLVNAADLLPMHESQGNTTGENPNPRGHANWVRVGMVGNTNDPAYKSYNSNRSLTGGMYVVFDQAGHPVGRMSANTIAEINTEQNRPEAKLDMLRMPVKVRVKVNDGFGKFHMEERDSYAPVLVPSAFAQQEAGMPAPKLLKEGILDPTDPNYGKGVRRPEPANRPHGPRVEGTRTREQYRADREQRAKAYAASEPERARRRAELEAQRKADAVAQREQERAAAEQAYQARREQDRRTRLTREHERIQEYLVDPNPVVYDRKLGTTRPATSPQEYAVYNLLRGSDVTPLARAYGVKTRGRSQDEMAADIVAAVQAGKQPDLEVDAPKVLDAVAQAEADAKKIATLDKRRRTAIIKNIEEIRSDLAGGFGTVGKERSFHLSFLSDAQVQHLADAFGITGLTGRALRDAIIAAIEAGQTPDLDAHPITSLKKKR